MEGLSNLPFVFIEDLVEGITDHFVHLVLKPHGSLVLHDHLGCLFLGLPDHHLSCHGLLLNNHGPALDQFKLQLKSADHPSWWINLAMALVKQSFRMVIYSSFLMIFASWSVTCSLSLMTESHSSWSLASNSFIHASWHRTWFPGVLAFADAMSALLWDSSSYPTSCQHVSLTRKASWMT